MTSCIPGITILVDPKALMHIVGTTMDWYEDELTAEFVFNNPNAKVRVTRAIDVDTNTALVPAPQHISQA